MHPIRLPADAARPRSRASCDDIVLSTAAARDPHPAGSTVLVPFAAGDVEVTGRALVARPPHPEISA